MVNHLLNSRKFRYLIVGGVNTAFGYLVGVGIYKLLVGFYSIWIIGLISNLLAIAFSFVTYKLFVFKTKGQWVTECIKAYLIYGLMALIGIVFLWFYVDSLGFSIWMAQGLVILSTVILSYIGHSRVTFRRKGL